MNFHFPAQAVRCAALGALFAASSLLAAPPPAAQLTAMVAVDPSAAVERGIHTVYGDLGVSLGKALRTPVRVDRSTNFADVLRSTRTGEYDIYIVPVQVAASGLAHGYAVLADSGQQETYVLVAPSAITSVAKLRGARMYLPQQDSIYSYMAKGLLNEAGLSLKDLGPLVYQKTSGAGLVALEIGMADATVARKAEYEKWAAGKGGRFKPLLESKPVPAGAAVLVKKSLPAPLQDKLARWAAEAGLVTTGSQAVAATSGYAYVAGLGNFTPAQLPGVRRVTAHEAADLMRSGAVMVDVRTPKEFAAKHIAGAVLAPYVEKSVKDPAFDASLDEFQGLAKLDRNTPTIFGCNGAECWKSYKAAKAAAAQGFKTVYWLRGGLPEWSANGLPVRAAD